MKKILLGILVISMLLCSCYYNGEKSQFSSQSTSEMQEKKEDSKVKQIKVGSKIKTEDMNVKIKAIEFSYDVLPDSTDGFYTHYQADKGNVYIHIDASVKNKAKQNLQCDEIMTVFADYNDGYEYKSFTVPESKTTGFTYANITNIKPLETLGVRFLIECPEEVADSDKPLILTFKIDGSDEIYEYTMR